MTQIETKFRLRVNETQKGLPQRIVGFEKWNDGKDCEGWLYSVDGERWSSNFIFHNEKDQFTGLHDKNGKEIYEGDILRDVHPIRTAKGYTGGDITVEWGHSEVYMESAYGFNIVPELVSDYEIIGNIYENPNLLTPRKEK